MSGREAEPWGRFVATESIPAERSRPKISKSSAKYWSTAPVPQASSSSVVAEGFRFWMSDFKPAETLLRVLGSTRRGQ